MTKSLRALLEGVIDYAGLFPPASLALDTALEEFTTHRRDPLSWMLSRFVIPAGLLPEITLDTALKLSSPHFSVLIGGGRTQAEFVANVKEGVTAAAQFNERLAGKCVADAFEVKIDARAVGKIRVESVSEFLRIVCDAVHSGIPTTPTKTVPVYCEFVPEQPISSWPKGEDDFASFIAGISQFNRSHLGAPKCAGEAFGFKFRSGGVNRDDFPPVAALAFALTQSRLYGVPFKATAGLHHPLYHQDSALGVKMHGFINVFAAGVLAHVHQLSDEVVSAILSSEQPDNFRFDDEGLSWRELSASVTEISQARRGFIRSFGSCSFTDPRDGLDALGLISSLR